MTRIATGLFFLSSVFFAACGDGDATCAPGTTLQDGQCIAAGVDTTVGGTDTTITRDTAAPQPDATIALDVNTDTSTPQPDVYVPPDVTGQCSDEELGTRDFGAACSKSCQCMTDLGAYCYTGPFLNGFSFCTRDGGLAGQLNAEEYPTLRYNSACWDFPGAQWTSPMSKACKTMADCALLSDAYTNCGTAGLSWHGGSATETLCPNRAGAEDPRGFTVMSSKKVCIINTLPPFDRR